MEEVPLRDDNNQHIDKETLECITKTRTCCSFTSTVSAAFMFIFCILFPWITEIIIVSQIPPESSATVVLVCGVLQTIIAIYGSIRLGMTIFDTCKSSNKEKGEWNDFWYCGRCTNFKSLVSGGYVVYALPQWFLTNAIISWILIDQKKIILPFYVHLMVYTPGLAYIVCIFIGFAIGSAMDQCKYQQV